MLGRRRGPPIVALLATAVVVTVAAAVALVGAGKWFGSSGGAAPAPRFVDVTDSSGVAITYDGPLELAAGSGVAVLDCDGDGRPDLYLPGGAQPAGLFHNDGAGPGQLHFSKLSDPMTDVTNATGAYPIDVDGDGHVDLMVLRSGENVALRGLGACRFERANKAWGLDGDFETMAFSATWEPGSSWPTIAFGNYVDPTIEDPTRWCQPNLFVRPAPSARAWGPAQSLEPGWCTLSMLFSAWDGSGRADLRVSNDRHYYPEDRGQEQLWRIERGAPPRLYTAADGWGEVQVEGMGIGSYDLTGDGLPEIYLTSQAANHLMTLTDGASKPAYRDIGLDRGTNVPHPVVGEDTAFPSTSWHPEFADVNNDGLVDLYVSKGNVSQQADFAKQDPSNLLLGQPDGTFREATEGAGLVRFDKGRGTALVDLDLDGRLDVVESFYGAPVRIWRNAGQPESSTPGHWLALRVEQPGPNVDAIGAVVEITVGSAVVRRELTIGGGHGGGQLGWIHVGLGPAEHADVRVRWSDGSTSPLATVPADTFQIVDRSTGVRAWLP